MKGQAQWFFERSAHKTLPRRALGRSAKRKAGRLTDEALNLFLEQTYLMRLGVVFGDIVAECTVVAGKLT
jgi:hypothetical protein